MRTSVERRCYRFRVTVTVKGCRAGVAAVVFPGAGHTRAADMESLPDLGEQVTRIPPSLFDKAAVRWLARPGEERNASLRVRLGAPC
jgi:hypothetical protein